MSLYCISGERCSEHGRNPLRAPMWVSSSVVVAIARVDRSLVQLRSGPSASTGLIFFCCPVLPRPSWVEYLSHTHGTIVQPFTCCPAVHAHVLHACCALVTDKCIDCLLLPNATPSDIKGRGCVSPSWRQKCNSRREEGTT
jgi:hypothetical protein